MPRMHIVLGALVVAASVPLTSPIAAQDFMVTAEDSAYLARSYAGGAAVAGAMNSYARDRAGRSAPRSRGQRSSPPPAAPTPPTASQRRTLNFARDAAITRDVNQRLAESMARPGNGINAEALTAALNTGRMQGEFGRLLREFDMSPDNLADVVAGYLIINWEVANETDSRPFSRGYAAVRNDVASALTASGATQRLSAAEKQAFADALIATAMLTVEGRRQLLRSRDNAAKQRLRNAARDGARQMGVDVTAVRLTNAGFVPR